MTRRWKHTSKRSKSKRSWSNSRKQPKKNLQRSAQPPNPLTQSHRRTLLKPQLKLPKLMQRRRRLQRKQLHKRQPQPRSQRPLQPSPRLPLQHQWNKQLSKKLQKLQLLNLNLSLKPNQLQILSLRQRRSLSSLLRITRLMRSCKSLIRSWGSFLSAVRRLRFSQSLRLKNPLPPKMSQWRNQRRIMKRSRRSKPPKSINAI